jgi:hypothetical protein
MQWQRHVGYPPQLPPYGHGHVRGHGQGGNKGNSGGLSGGLPSWHVGIPTLIFYLVFSTHYIYLFNDSNHQRKRPVITCGELERK